MEKLTILFAIIIPLLSGCAAVPIAFVAGAAAGGTIIADKRSIKTILRDRHAAQTAQNRIDQDRVLDHKSHISVAVFNHIGLMVGQAQTPELRQRAFELVSTTPHIDRVYNEVTIAGATSWGQRSNDTWLTTKVRTAMLTKGGLRSNQIKVVTEDNVVYLMGVVSHRQANLATNVARRIKGVTKVVKVFQYT